MGLIRDLLNHIRCGCMDGNNRLQTNIIYHIEALNTWLSRNLSYPLLVEIDVDNNKLSNDILEKNLNILKNIGTKSIVLVSKDNRISPHFWELVDMCNRYKFSIGVDWTGRRIENITPIINKISAVKISLDKLEDIGKIENLVMQKKKTSSTAAILLTSGFAWKDRREHLYGIEEVSRLDVDKIIIEIDEDDKKSFGWISRKISGMNKDIVIKMPTRRKNEFRYCYIINFYCYIDNKGNVLPCRSFKNYKSTSYGNLKNKDFKEIWANRKTDIYVKDCRYKCRFCNANRFLNNLKHDKSSIRDFILDDIYTSSY